MVRKSNIKNAVDLSSTRVVKKSVKAFLNNELKEYARYVIETRALPNIMDGLRVGARKVISAALDSTPLKNGSMIKMNSLVGKTLDLQYHHGNTSLEGTIVQLASSHTFNTPPLSIVGQIGSLRVPDNSTAARYLNVKASPFLDMFRVDMELTIPQEDEGIKIEPKFFLPIIPVCLLQRTSNPGFGFSFKGFSFNVSDVIEATLVAVLDGTCDEIDNFIPIRPRVEGIKDDNFVYNENKESWYNVGECDLDFQTSMVRIRDLPYNVSYESFEDNLANQIEKGLIVKYENHSTNGLIDYRVQFPIGRLKMLYESNKWRFYKSMMMFSRVPKLTLNCIDESGTKILSFETPQQLINAFVQRRLKYYTKRKNLTIKNLQERVALLEERNLFIRLVIDGTIIINKRSIKDINKDLDKYKINHDVLKLPVSRLTKDEMDKGEREIKEAKKILDYINKTSEKEMYVNDLIALREKIEPIVNKMDVK